MLKEYQKKINLSIICLIASGVILHPILLGMNIINTLIPTVAMIVGIPIAIVTYRKDYVGVTKYINIMIIAIMVIVLMLENPVSSCGMGMFLLIAGAIYFDSKIPIVMSIIASIIEFYNWKVGNIAMNDYVMRQCILGFAPIMLYFITQWGRKMIENSEREQNNALTLLKQLEETMAVIHSNTLELDNNVLASHNYMQVVEENSLFIEKSMEEMTAGIVSQTEGLNKINQMMIETESKVLEVNQLSNNLNDISKETNKAVLDGSQDIHHMSTQMRVISTASEKNIRYNSTIK